MNGGLNIEGATIGFDSDNIEKALINLETHVIQDTINQMETSLNDLEAKVDAAWQGKAANDFKQNLRYDKDKIAKELEASYEKLRTTLYEIANDMAKADETLVTKKGGSNG